ncbi:hypothetical protein HPB51_019334 [Rhipicephalus microplus]|uniref:Uncharacterized protein n=1 Tax=Rhipicephalus microplus TaxID=6941 RepID=A0A9J6DBN7_RHIMP|nr:hypothetical protein HPB51_019334 [Rhipicephalus microplus]
MYKQKYRPITAYCVPPLRISAMIASVNVTTSQPEPDASQINGHMDYLKDGLPGKLTPDSRLAETYDELYTAPLMAPAWIPEVKDVVFGDLPSAPASGMIQRSSSQQQAPTSLIQAQQQEAGTAVPLGQPPPPLCRNNRER